MQLLINVFCFTAGVLLTIGALVVWAWYLKMQDRLAAAEQSKRDLENAIQAIEEQQKMAANALQNNLTELIRRRSQNLAAASPQAQGTNVAATVKERLRKAVELTGKQAKIDIHKGPEFVMQHNELELEKLSVLKSILADGFDPVITIRYNTGDQDMLLSSYIQSISKGLA